MTAPDSLQGLSCPRCGGIVPIPEGQAIVCCPYCDLRSLVQGERGLRRYQVPQQASREVALKAMQRFLSHKMAVARDAARRAQLVESFVVYLPFWTIWVRLVGWAFGEKEVGSGDSRKYEPREVRIVEELTWNSAACDVGEFGVGQINLTDQRLEPFNAGALHGSGMVFEPVNAFSDVQKAAERQFEAEAHRKAKLDRLSQLFTRIFRRRYGLVYYPLWVLRYLYNGRAFQVVVDGYTGNVLYAKAPGNTFYRVAVLIAGMALGAFLAIDASAFFVAQFSDGDDSPCGLVIFLVIIGIALMVWAYRTFRHGEQFEFRSGAASTLLTAISDPVGTIKTGFSSIVPGSLKVEDVEKWIKLLD